MKVLTFTKQRYCLKSAHKIYCHTSSIPLTISGIEVHALRGPKVDRPHWTSHFPVPTGNEIYVKLIASGRFEKKFEGIGFATSYTNLDPLIKPWQSRYFEDFILGSDALAPAALYHKLFNLTTDKVLFQRGWSREALIRLSAAVDIACWDIMGKVAGLPLWRLFGGYNTSNNVSVPCYATCGYYREGKTKEELGNELVTLLRMKPENHNAIKVKTGGGRTIQEDIDRLIYIRKVLNEERCNKTYVDLMIDANRAWDMRTAAHFIRLVEAAGDNIRPRWLEEPCRWEDDRRGSSILKQNICTSIPISGGESEITSFGCRSLLEERGVDILQFDVTMYGGFTEGRKLMSLCELNHIDVAPHHDCFIHSHLVASSPAGVIVEAFCDPERDPLQAELFTEESKPKIIDGHVCLGEEPGLGLEVSSSALKKYGERIL